MSAALTFEPVTFNVVDRNGVTWLRAAEIARALGYSKADKVSNLYRAHAREFTPQMTALVKLQDLEPRNGVADLLEPQSVASYGQTREVRIFSPRGAHLLAMLSRTPKAAEFRRWVLDVLEAQTHVPSNLLARLQAAEHAEAQSFTAAQRASLAMHRRRHEKPRLLSELEQAREAVQMSLQLEGGRA